MNATHEEALAKLRALTDEAATNKRADMPIPAIGRVRRKGIVLHREALNDPDAPHHDVDGFCAFESMHQVRDFYAKKTAKTGRRYRVDPAGGGPTSEDIRREAAARRDRIAKRAEEAKRRGSIKKRLLKELGRTE